MNSIRTYEIYSHLLKLYQTYAYVFKDQQKQLMENEKLNVLIELNENKENLINLNVRFKLLMFRITL